MYQTAQGPSEPIFCLHIGSLDNAWNTAFQNYVDEKKQNSTTVLSYSLYSLIL